MRFYLVLLLLIFSSSCFAQESENPFNEYIWQFDSIHNRKIYFNPDVMPRISDSSKSIHEYFIKNFKYPATECIQTKIVISFVVEETGEITNKKIINKLNCEISIEILNFLDSLPKIESGLIQGKKVPVQLTIPIIIDFK